MPDMELFVNELLANKNDTLLKRQEDISDVLDILINQCDTKNDLDEHLKNGRLTEQKLLNLLDDIEDLLKKEDAFSELFNDIFNKIYQRQSEKIKHRLL